MSQHIELAAADGHRFDAYVAAPPATPRGAIVVLQEIFGVNAHVRGVADGYAADGYLVVAPALFDRVERGLEIGYEPADVQRGIALKTASPNDKALLDIAAAIGHAAKASGGKVGIVGYCLGGKMSYLAATRTDVDASVAYYGGGIDGLLGEAHAIANPLMLHFAGDDHFITAEALAKIHAELDGNRHAAIHEYPGVDHGFATESGKRRVEQAANLADSRTSAFFAEHLG